MDHCRTREGARSRGEAGTDGRGSGARREGLGGTGGPEVEADGGPGTACGHWDEDLYDDEPTTGQAGGSMAMSRATP